MTNKQRILDISKKLGLAHIGSNLSCLPILEEIYAKKKSGDIVILDNAHAHLAHLMVLAEYIKEKEFEKKHNSPFFLEKIPDPERLINKYGIHCDRKAGCDASGGSLGHGLGISIGYALADRTRDVWTIISDGSMQEGSNWEALRIASQLHLDNLQIYANLNGYTAVAEIDKQDLVERINAFYHGANIRFTDNGEGFEGVAGHYKKIQ